MGSLRWAEFAAAAPELAAHGHTLIERFGFVLIGTIRADGTPRIVLQSPVTEAAEPGAEFKLRGHAVEASAERLRTATADTVETVSGWRPLQSWLFLSITVQAAAHVAWAGEEMTLTCWDHKLGLRGPERRRLDPRAGMYRGA